MVSLNNVDIFVMSVIMTTTFTASVNASTHFAASGLLTTSAVKKETNVDTIMASSELRSTAKSLERN